jgi:hypothetical protein
MVWFKRREGFLIIISIMNNQKLGEQENLHHINHLSIKPMV